MSVVSQWLKAAHAETIRLRDEDCFQNDLRRAEKRWQQLIEQRKAVAPLSGKTAILLSTRPNPFSMLSSFEQDLRLKEYAEQLRETITRRPGGDTGIFYASTRELVRQCLRKPHVSDVVTIGIAPGNDIGTLVCRDGSEVSWKDFAKWTPKLLGSVEQRQHGLFEERHSVALGAFAVSNPGNVTCYPGVIVPIGNPGSSIELESIYDGSMPVIDQIKSVNYEWRRRGYVDMTSLSTSFATQEAEMQT